MKRYWQIFLSFAIPMVLAGLCLAAASFVMNGKMDCRASCMIFESCADGETLFLLDMLSYPGIGFFLLAFILPVMIKARERSIIENHIFEQDSSRPAMRSEPGTQILS